MHLTGFLLADGGTVAFAFAEEDVELVFFLEVVLVDFLLVVDVV